VVLISAFYVCTAVQIRIGMNERSFFNVLLLTPGDSAWGLQRLYHCTTVLPSMTVLPLMTAGAGDDTT
jgi:hypothetical protein